MPAISSLRDFPLDVLGLRTVIRRSRRCRTFWHGGPKTGAQKNIPVSLFPFLDRGNYSRGSKNRVLVTSYSGSAQAMLRFAHLQLRLKQQLLRSKDRNRNSLYRDSDVECPVSPPESRPPPAPRGPASLFAQGQLRPRLKNFDSGPARLAHPADRAVAEPGPIP